MSMEFYISGKPVSRKVFRERLYAWVFDNGRETIREVCQRLRDGSTEEFSSVLRNDDAGDTCIVETFHVSMKEKTHDYRDVRERP